MKTRILRMYLFGLAMLVGATADALADDGASRSATPGVAGAVNPAAATNNLVTSTQNSLPKALTTKELGIGQMPSPPRLSPWSSQVLKLTMASVDEDVVISYIDSAGTFNLTAEQIITLTQSGVPRNVLAAMIQHDADIVAGVRQVLPGTVPISDEDTLFIPPPPRTMDARASARPSSVASAPQSLAPNEEIEAAPDFAPYFILAPPEEVYEPAEMRERSPVRKPYAVPLTAPILVWRTEGRIPNTVLLDPFP